MSKYLGRCKTGRYLTVLSFFLALFFVSTTSAAAEKGRLYVVGMGPSGPDLTAPRALSVIESADIFLCSPGMPKKFALFKKYIDPAKVAFNPWKEVRSDALRKLKETDPKAWEAGIEKGRKKVQDFIRDKINAGKTVVIMDGGDPCVYGPTLYYLLKGFDPDLFEVVPGMGAFNAASAALKQSLTPDGERFILLTAPRSLFGENWEKDDDILKDLSKYKTTMVWYMALRSLDKVVQRFEKYYPKDLPIAIVYYAGYPDKEKVLRSNLGNILEDVKKMDEWWLGLFITGQCAK
ncbi:MAG: hypothetical protein JEZ11_08770 [Desulfobacterales bacterium]|nr:hypothetical protein [Desulfobacterales bacterium]